MLIKKPVENTKTKQLKSKYFNTEAAQAILDARAAHSGESLAALYDPLVMPADLLKAHATLDSPCG